MVASSAWQLIGDVGEADKGWARIGDVLADVDQACCINPERVDYLLVRACDADTVLVMGFHRESEPVGYVRMRQLRCPQRINVDYSVIENDDLLTPARKSYSEFMSWAGTLLRGSEAVGEPNELLIVKVDPSQLWFLRFPLALYIRFRFGEFSHYGRIQWIVTTRTFAENARDRVAGLALFKSTAALLRHTVIVVNLYREHLQSTCGQQVVRAFRILEGLFSQLQDVVYEGRSVSLRWLINPSAEVIRATLLSPQTKIVLAGFEARSGAWEIAAPIQCLSPTIVLQEHAETGFFDVRELEYRLRHIQLLRVFHCHSAFNGFEASLGEGEPTDRGTLVRQLLNTGAQWVEGGMTEETFLSFAASVVQFVFGTGLAAVMESRAAEGAVDLPETLRRCNELLRGQGFPTVSQ